MIDKINELKRILKEMEGITSPRQWPGRTRFEFVLELLEYDDDQEDLRRMAVLAAARELGYDGYVPWPKRNITEERIAEGDYWVPRSIAQLEQRL